LLVRSILRISAAAVISAAGLGAAVIFAAGAMSAIVPPVSDPAGANPPGNNGTMKIDGFPFDVHPDNEPHVGCSFQVDFYGFDQGDLDADVLFEAIPPTGTGEDLLSDTAFIGEDANSGGGSESGLDASRTYDLTATLQGLTAQPEQGYHVKLTIHADGSQGTDTKYNVFWVSGCQPGSPPTIAGSPLTALLCPTTGPQTPTPFNGATEESPRSGDPKPHSPAATLPRDVDVLGVDVNGCAAGPFPTIAESPLPLLLPLTAVAALLGALLLRRRYEGVTHPVSGEGRAED
jgi:hypothetical protein